MARNESSLPSTSLAYCLNQTAGRGQRGNSWESAPGENITASLMIHPSNFPAHRQFSLSEAISLAIIEFLSNLGVEAKVKWPNDIYVGDKKICGILVENVVMEKNITRSIAGFGININQKKFISNAPNPISLSMITGKNYEIRKLIEELANILERYLKLIDSPEALHQLFLTNLWRKDGADYKFIDRKSNEPFTGRIHTVEPDGTLSIMTPHGEKREFAFKEIEFVI